MHSRPLTIVLLVLAVAGAFASAYWLRRTPVKPAQRHYAAGLRQEAAGDFPAAVREWQIAVALDPRLPNAHLALGRGFLNQGAVFHAVRELETAARQSPTAPHLWCLLAEGYRKLDQQRRAEEAARFAAGAEPKCPRARRAYGAVLFDRGEHRKAATELSQAASLDSRDVESRTLLARTWLALKDGDNAEKTAREAHEAAAGSPATAAVLAHVLLEQDRPDQLPMALELLNSAVSAFPNDADVRADRGRAYRLLQRSVEARAELERAVRLAPRHRLAVAELALLYEALGKEQEAAEHRGLSREMDAADRRRGELEALLQQRPDDSAILFELADLLARDQKFPRALALMQRAAELRPEDPRIHRQLRDIRDAARRSGVIRVGSSR